MNQEFLKLTGRIISTNTADQSFLIEVQQSHNRLWVYADNKIFQRLNNSLLSARLKGAKDKELTGTFYIQGRVLMSFKVSIRPTVFHIGDVYLETNEDCRSLLGFIRGVIRAVHPGLSK